MKYFLAGCIFLFVNCSFAKVKIAEKKDHSLFWEIQKLGTLKKSYLYGTIHISNDTVFNLPAEIFKAIETSDFFCNEINMDSINPLAMMSALILPEGQEIKKLISDKEYIKLDSALQKTMGIPLSMMNKIKPFYIGTILQIGEISNKNDSSSKKSVLDVAFYQYAKNKSVPIKGLEEVDDQLKLLNNITLAKQVAFLKKMIGSFGTPDIETKIETKSLMDSYLKGDIFTMSKISQNDTSISNTFESDFLIKRNYTMVNSISTLIESGKSSFSAIGAAHFGGNEGVINLLKLKGYVVTPVKSNSRTNSFQSRKMLNK